MGLTEFHKKQQKETEREILKWMLDFSVNEPKLIWISSDNDKKEVEKRVYWINGISKGTGIYKETVRKSLERLIEQELIWEWPNTRQTRFFQLCFNHWKQHYKYFIKQDAFISIPIPRIKGSVKERKKLILSTKKKIAKPKKSITLKELAERLGMSEFYTSLSD